MKNKVKVQTYIYAVVSVILMILIFSFSSQNGNSSGELSSSLSKLIYSAINFLLNCLNLDVTNISALMFHTFIRKLAHFSVYFALGFSFYGFFNSLNKTKVFSIYFALVSSLFYAITDELHQSFIPDRGPSVIDVCIDFSGSIFGVLLCITIYKFINNKRVKSYKG